MAKRIFTSIALLILIAVTSFPVYAAFPGELYDNDEFDFSVPEGLESRVKFWKKVYTQYSTQHAIIHDIDDLNVIYDVVYLGDKPLSSRQRRRKLRPYIRKYKKILRKLARQKDYNNLDYEEERIY
ncbi:MAG: hypothetical protein GWM98_27925, partial [Nitrospinaceae bacterium]|nr:hypothetical protein [Nitrospinaceae bacterium]NIR57583.1 hypothetical protein [Nitrospinaceae bacterium]NIS88053.1 hypothetical protein [Nitrospinaceae bacterium]NIT84917.1 hypothetical protein [Nitrospinaceae bacterium]NIU47093.1 hypothetical protein [Nitrospinaceae bacterium]